MPIFYEARITDQRFICRSNRRNLSLVCDTFNANFFSLQKLFQQYGVISLLPSII